MKTRIIIGLLTSFLLFAGINLTFSQSAEQQYQKGLMQEEGEGNLEEAINIYNSIVENQNAGQSLQAKALLHVGLCYEKMGKEEATKAYQKLVNNFPSQKNEVAIARERLSKLILAVEKIEGGPLTPKFTKIKIPTKLSWSVALSPDGKDLALVSDKKLWKMPLSGNLGPDIPGTPVQLNTGDIEVEWSGLDWSGDGKWIAFNDYPKHDEKGEYIKNQSIYIVPSDGGMPNKIIENYRDVRVVNYRISLSPNGKNLAFSSIEENKQHIFSTSVDNVISKQLTEMEAREPVFSPDGKYIAFVKDKNKGRGEGDLGLWIIEANGGKPYKLADAGKASSPIWSPDGNLIAFLDYSVGTQISIVPFSKTENTIGKVIRIDAPLGTEEVRLLAGWTPENKIGALLVSKMEFGLYTLPANGGQAAMIMNDINAYQPRWSRDSKKIYYVTQPLEGGSKSYRQFIASVSSSGGKGVPLQANIKGKSIKQFAFQSGNRVSPDGKWIITSTWTPGDTNTVKVHWPTSKIWKVSVEGDDAIQITNAPGNFSDMSPCWSPDGKNVAFVRFQLEKGKDDIFGGAPKIYSINSSGGEPELLVSISGKYVNSVIWSPDGRTIAYLTKEINQPHTKNLNLYDLETKESRIVGNIEAANVNNEMAWSPDSKRIAFNDAEGKVIKIITLSDERIEEISTGLVDANIYHLDWSPDGRRFVFGGWKGGEAEFWFMEDFLPLDKLAQNNETEVTLKATTLQKVWLGSTTIGWGDVSPNGLFLTYANDSLNLGIREFSTGKTSSLTNDAAEDPLQFNMGSTISPNNKKVAYAWYKNNHQIRLVDVDNPQQKVLYANKDEDVWPCAWSPDGKTIYARSILNKTGKCRILAVDATNGDIQILKTFDHIFWVQLSVSPDNKFIAYNFSNNKNGEFSNTDIHLISTDGKNETKLFEHPANDQILGWFPNKNQILFKSDRSGTWDAWTVAVVNGKVIGEPKRVLTEIGENASQMGFTNNGTFYYSLMSRNFNGFITPFNQPNGELKSELAKPLLGSVRTAKWSPDGKSLVLIKEVWNVNGRPIFILDAETGKERMLSDRFNAQHLLWLQDSKTLLILGYDEKRKTEKNYTGGMYTIDAQSGEINELLSFSDYRGKNWEIGLLVAQMLAEGNNNQKSIYYLKNGQLVSRELVTGQEKMLLQNQSFNSNNYTLDPLPGEKNLLFCNEDQIYIIPTTGGKQISIAKRITTNTGPTVENSAVWTTDGNYIFYTQNIDGGSILWRISSDGVNPKEVYQSKVPISSLSIHPDGQKIVITTLDQGAEIWKVDNLLSNEETVNLQK